MSGLVEQANDYLQLRHALGHKLNEAHRLLPSFITYLDAIGAETVTVEAALTWAQRRDADPASSVWIRRMAVARGFARHMAGVDPNTEIPPFGLVTFRQRWHPPFIYSKADITALMVSAQKTIPSPLRAATVETLIGLLAATGMRVGEAMRLERADLDRVEQVVVVRNSKFGKSRIVPLQTSVIDALDSYAEKRDRLQPRPKSPTLFVSTVGTQLRYSDFCQTFRRLVDAAGVGIGAPYPPKIHGLRHSFAVETLLKWYRCGANVEAMLPRLATYLGHRDPKSTYWYLSAAPELLAVALDRLETAQRGRS